MKLRRSTRTEGLTRTPQVFTCFHALSAMCSFMLNLHSLTTASMSLAGSCESPTSMLSLEVWPLSFSMILSKKKHLNQKTETEGVRVLKTRKAFVFLLTEM